MNLVGLHPGTIITFILYIITMMVIGVYFFRKTEDTVSYYIGNRGMSPWVTALSAGASDMSGWLLLGLPGYMYLSGVESIWIGLGLVMGALFNWLVVAKRLRVHTGFHHSVTLSDYFTSRFQDKQMLLRIITALVTLFFFTIYVSSGLVAGAKLFESSFGLSYHYALVLGALIIVAYTFLGGYHAVCWTDLVQGLLMVASLVVVPAVVVFKLGGLENTVDSVRQLDPTLLDPFKDLSVISLVSLLAWGLGYMGQPHILTRFISIESPSKIGSATRINIIWMIIGISGALMVGLSGLAYFSSQPLEDPEKVFLKLTQLLFNPWIAGVLLAAILAAVMSTIDSQLLISSSVMGNDILPLFKRIDPKRHLMISRLSVLAVAVIAVLIASDANAGVLSLVSYAWAGFGAAFGPVIILSLISDRISRDGALAGMLVGAVTVAVWGNLEGGLFDLYEIVPGFVLCGLTTWFVSYFRPPSESVRQAFKKAHQELESF